MKTEYSVATAGAVATWGKGTGASRAESEHQKKGHLMQKQIVYQAWGKPDIVVLLPADIAVSGELTQEQRAQVLDASRRAGVPINRRLARIYRMRARQPDVVEAARRYPIACWPQWAHDPQPEVFKEEMPAGPPAIFVAIGSDVVAEFWPAKA